MNTDSSEEIQPSALLSQRRAGVILHPTSLPSSNGLGDLGPNAYRFIDFMAESDLSIWQMLPTGPVHDDLSPYMSLSVYAGNTSLISLELLVEWGWLEEGDLKGVSAKNKSALLKKAVEGFKQCSGDDGLGEYKEFLRRNKNWLDDYALFEVLRAYYKNKGWSQWPHAFRFRNPEALQQFKNTHEKAIDKVNFGQFVFCRQWFLLKQYANERNIIIMGDVPIFVAHDSADVWQNQDYFDLKEDGSPRVVAGVPPDYFSETGQRWGNPLYRWDKMAENNYKWWVNRFRSAFTQYDAVRVDHFRGFEAYWEIDAEEDTAINGRWVKAPGKELFQVLKESFDALPIIVEDLGTITPEVEELRDTFGWPGMKILQFAFDSNDDNPYLPANHIPNCVVYTGTHDNDTTLSWYEDLPQHTKDQINHYIGSSSELMPWSMIECAFRSVANWAITPMQDLMSLGKGNRMNIPGVTQDNWNWQFEWQQVHEQLSSKIKTMVVQFERDV